MKKTVSNLLIVSRKVSVEERTALLKELAGRFFTDISEVKDAFEKGELLEDSINNYYTQWDIDMIERYSEKIGIIDWGEIRSTLGLMAARSCFEDLGIPCEMKKESRMYGCYLNSLGEDTALLSDKSFIIRDIVFLGLSVFNHSFIE